MIDIVSHLLLARASLVAGLSRLSWRRLAALGRRRWRAFWTVTAGA
ncbi:hypothetical protein [Bradyrhizobium yuanmingense]|nr:hypothetical protein [Bradyrhizobium yuanmingense]